MSLACIASAIGAADVARAAETPALAWPHLPFGEQDTALAREAIALTFDDGPGSYEQENVTSVILDVLKAHGVQATFFLCGGTFANLQNDQVANKTVRRMRRDGHAIGNHTYMHRRANDLSTEDIVDQFSRNELYLQSTLQDETPLSLYRMPYGMPFYGKDDHAFRVAPVVRSFGVHVGWGIDSGDWKCNRDGLGAACIVDVVKQQILKGHRGPLLMHSLFAPSAEALPHILAFLRDQSIRIVSIDDMIYARYGMRADDVRRAALSLPIMDDEIGEFARERSRAHPPWPVSY